MLEKEIVIDQLDPLVILGVNNKKLTHVRRLFPKNKIISRGNVLKVYGSEEEIKTFSVFFERAVKFYNKFNRLSTADMDGIFGDAEGKIANSEDDKVIVYGNGGVHIKARTPNQIRMVEEIVSNDMMFAIGPAGTGKTYTAVALAVKALKDKQVRKIILTRPAVEAGENLGFLPGDLKEKLDPYLQPLYDALRDMIPREKLADYLEEGVIQIAPLAFMRGRTLDKAFVILDEAQNATESQIKMFLTRMGQSAKFVITGDETQVDLPKHQPSGLVKALRILDGIDGISIVRLDGKDVIRHPLVKKVINAFENK